jgi:hypothetical protein
MQQKKRQIKKFWEELMSYFPLIRHGPRRKRRLQKIFTQLLPSNDTGIQRQTHTRIA